MYVAVIDPPDVPPVSLEEAKVHLRVDHSDEDDYILGCINAACSHIDGPQAWLGRSLITQTLEARFDAFDDDGLRIMYGPVAAITSVKYDDENGVEQTLSSAIFRLAGPDSLRFLKLIPGQSWPATYQAAESVRVRFQAGYGDAGEDVPAAIRQAILLMVGDLYRTRETVSLGSVSKIEMSLTVESLLRPFRVYY